MTRPLPRVAIVGAGKLGTGLARALQGAGIEVELLRRPSSGWGDALRRAGVVILAVPDDAIGGVAGELAATGGMGGAQVVLHTSGSRDRSALLPLEGKVAGLGSFAPAQTVADPGSAAERLRGAYAVIEGDAEAVRAGKGMAEALGMAIAEIPATAKGAYHVGATLVANLGVPPGGMAERVAVEGGVPAEVAAKIYLPLWRGRVANIEVLGPVKALTGPVRRGDVETIRRHLALLKGEDRSTYIKLSLEALRLARVAGLEGSKAAAVEGILR